LETSRPHAVARTIRWQSFFGDFENTTGPKHTLFNVRDATTLHATPGNTTMKHVPSAITQILITAVFATGCSADLADSESAEEKVGQATQFETEGQPNFGYVDVDGDSQYVAGVDH